MIESKVKQAILRWNFYTITHFVYVFNFWQLFWWFWHYFRGLQEWTLLAIGIINIYTERNIKISLLDEIFKGWSQLYVFLKQEIDFIMIAIFWYGFIYTRVWLMTSNYLLKLFLNLVEMHIFRRAWLLMIKFNNFLLLSAFLNKIGNWKLERCS